MNYQTKPIKVEAIQWKGEAEEFLQWAKTHFNVGNLVVNGDLRFDVDGVGIHVKYGDWVIDHVEPYVVTDEAFKDEYEKELNNA